MKRRVKEWLNFSKNDLDVIEKLLESDSLTQAVAFHCQQSIEKAFKAIIEEKENKIPRLHDLTRLYGIISAYGINLEIDEDILSEINDVYTETRYPSDLGLIPNGVPSFETVKRFQKLAIRIYSESEAVISNL
jgi:HEPN domain-containing protein